MSLIIFNIVDFIFLLLIVFIGGLTYFKLKKMIKEDETKNEPFEQYEPTHSK